MHKLRERTGYAEGSSNEIMRMKRENGELRIMIRVSLTYSRNFVQVILKPLFKKISLLSIRSLYHHLNIWPSFQSVPVSILYMLSSPENK